MSEIFSKLSEVTPISWGIIIAILVISVIGYIFTTNRNTSNSSPIKQVIYGGICISISFVLSYIRLYRFPQGGSVTPASMFPLVLYSMFFGPIAGIIASSAYGLLQLIQDMYAVNIIQLLLDYPLAFGCIGLAGITPSIIKNIYARTTLALFIAFAGRCFMHVLSGVVFFAEYAPEGISPLVYSISYNGAFMLVEFVITLVLSLILINTPVYSNFKKLATTSIN